MRALVGSLVLRRLLVLIQQERPTFFDLIDGGLGLLGDVVGHLHFSIALSSSPAGGSFPVSSIYAARAAVFNAFGMK
jgi:hypothetical protein